MIDYRREQRTLSRFADQHGVAVDISSAAYLSLWLRSPDKGLPTPDIKSWYREPELGLILPLSCAVAFDTFASGGSTTGVSLVFAFNNAAGDFLIVGTGTTGTISGVLYGTTPVPLVKQGTATGSGERPTAIYALPGAPTGNQNVTIALTSAFIYAVAASYSGTDTATQPDGTGEAHLNPSSSGSPLVVSATTSIANSMMVMVSVTTDLAGSGTTLRGVGDFNELGLFDSGTPVSAGSNSLRSYSSNGFVPANGVIMGVAPPGGGGGGGGVTLPELERFIRGLERGLYH